MSRSRQEIRSSFNFQCKLQTSISTIMKLVDLPYDVFMEFLFVVFPADLAALAQTSQPLNAFIKGNKLLWKTQYLQNLVCRAHPKFFGLC